MVAKKFYPVNASIYCGIIKRYNKNLCKGAITIKLKTFGRDALNSISKIFSTKDTKGNPFHSQAFGDFRGTSSFKSEKAQLNAYQQSSWVSIATDNLMRDAGGRKWWFEDIKGKEIENVDERIRLPFENGFANQPFSQMQQPIIGQRALTGNAYWIVSEISQYGSIRKMPEAFIPISPDRVKPVLTGSCLFLDHYEIDSAGNGDWKTLQPEEIIHFNQNTLYNPYMGIGNIEKASLMFETDARKAQFVNNFFKQGASPSMLITDNTDRLPQDITRISEMLNSKYSGAENAGKLMYLSGKNIDGKTLQMSHKDMEFLETQKFNRQTILSLFGVPPVVAGIPDGANKAIAGTMRLLYLENTINPIIQDMENAINQQYVHKIDKRVFLRLAKHTTGDVDNVIKKLQAGIITPNEASEALGESYDEADESREQYYMTAGLLPIGFVAPEEVPKDIPKGETKDLSDPHNVKAIMDVTKSATNPRKHQREYLEKGLRSRNKTEDQYVSKIDSFLNAQMKRILHNLEINADKIEALFTNKGLEEESMGLLFDLNFENETLVEVVRPLHTSGVQKAIVNVNDITGATVKESLSNPFVAKTINALGKNVIGSINKEGKRISINNTVSKDLVNIIRKSVAEDNHVNFIQGEINRKLGTQSSMRARRIARTESRIAYDAGNKIAYEELGVKVVDVIGCTQFEPDSDCGRQNIPINEMSSLVFHPNHIGVVVPREVV